MTAEVGAIICGVLIMLFVLGCAVLVLLAAIAKKNPSPQPPVLIIDPARPDLALTEDGQLVATPKVRP